jgi:hypothetical protein
LPHCRAPSIVIASRASSVGNRSSAPIRKILTHLGEPLEPAPISPARGPPTDWGELVQARDDRATFQASPDELPVIAIRSP